MKNRYVVTVAGIILGFFFLIAGIYYGRPFLVPVTFAALFAMLVLPIQNWLEGKGLNTILSAGINLLIIIGVFYGLLFILADQLANFSEDLPKLKEQLNSLLRQAKLWIENTFDIPVEVQEEYINNKSDSIFSAAGKGAQGLLMSIVDVFSGAFLILVYTFCCLIYRKKFAKFILKITPDNKKELTEETINNTSQVARQYLAGRLLLILFLAVVYAIGLSIVGIQHAIFFSILAALFSLLPYFGNIIGGTFPIATALLTGGGFGDVVGVFIVFSIAQLIENYLLEPMIIGTKVDLNPFFVILSIVAGGLIWGVPGMILANPLLGVIKVVFDNIKPLAPYGWLIGDESDSGIGRLFQKILKKN